MQLTCLQRRIKGHQTILVATWEIASQNLDMYVYMRKKTYIPDKLTILWMVAHASTVPIIGSTSH